MPNANDWNALQNPRRIFLRKDVIEDIPQHPTYALDFPTAVQRRYQPVYPAWRSGIGMVRIARSSIDLRDKPSSQLGCPIIIA